MSGNYFHNSLFQGNPFLETIFQGNCSTKPLFRGLAVTTGIFSKKALFQWDCVSARTPFRETVSQEPCFQRNCFSKNSFQRNCFSKNFFQRNSFSRNCSTKSPTVSGKLFQSIYSMCRNQTVPYIQTSFQETVSKVSFLLSKHRSKKLFPRSLFYYPNIVLRNYFQGLFFHMSLIHISKPHSKAPI